VLVTATVRRDRITALKLDRKEHEIITMFARITTVRHLPPQPDFFGPVGVGGSDPRPM
jgi:hypothetical protein